MLRPHPQRRNTCTHTPLIFASPHLTLFQFVYEPHIAPTFEAWVEDLLERRRAARHRRASAVPVRTSRRHNSSPSSDSSHHDNDPQRDRGESDRVLGPNDFVDGFELEALVSREVDEWRNEVLRSQERTKDGLRRRRTNRLREFDSFDSTSTTLDEVSVRCACPHTHASSIQLFIKSFGSLTHTPLASTHVISNVSSPITASTVSLPQTPTRRFRSESQSTTTQGLVIVPRSSPSPMREIPVMSPRTEFPDSAVLTPRPPTDSDHLDLTYPAPLAIPIADCRSPITEGAPHPLPFTPTYQVMAGDSPFGPLLPDTPRSTAEMYGDRPFSPITRVMGPSSGPVSTAGSKAMLSSRANSMNSTRTLGGSGILRKPSGLVNEVVTSGSDDGSDEESHPHASTSNFTLTNPGPGTNESVISSLSERYPAPPTPPVIISPPASSVGVISAPSSPRSGGSEVVVHHDATDSPSHLLPQTRSSPPLLRLPSESSSPGLISRSRSSAHSATSPALSYASFLSPMPISRGASESEGDEFLSVASDDSDWNASPVTPSERTGIVQDRANNPFLDFEHLTHGVRGNGSEHGGGSEVGSDESWGSARKH